MAGVLEDQSITLPGRRQQFDAAEVKGLFERCERVLGRYLAQLVRDRALAEDLLQDTFVIALGSLRDAAPINPEAWLFGVARNLGLQALRRRRRFDGVLAHLAFKRTAVAESEATVAVRDLLERTLTPEDSSLILLRYLHGFDAPELAEMTGMTPDAVRQRLSRARRKLLDAAGTREGDDR